MAPPADLTTTRINRLLRPLRVSCTLLAAHASTSCTSHVVPTGMVTYSRESTWRPAEKGPLAPILPPETLLVRHPSARHGVRNVELSKKLYAVRNAFRNLLQAALGAGPAGADTKGKRRMLSLSEICAAVVGEGIQEEIIAQMGEGSDISENEEDKEEMAITNEMYEYVPMQYRRCTLVSHALSLVLQTCPHDPTLLSSLLDITLHHRLSRESRLLLDAILCIAIPAPPPPASSSRSRTVPPLCHPAHTAYLTDLLSKWTAGPPSPSLSVRTFTDALLGALHRGAPPQLWAGKAVRRLARTLRTADFAAFVRLAAALAESLPPAPMGARSDDDSEDAHAREARKRLAKWMYTMFDRLYGDGATEGTPTPEQAEEHAVIVSFLLDAARAPPRMHVHSAPPMADGDDDDDDDDDDVADTAVSLAAFCLASPLAAHLPAGAAAKLATLLGEAVPRPTAFDSLVLLVFPLRAPAGTADAPADTDADAPPDAEATLGSPHHILRVLTAHARALRAHALPRLEAALWAGALRTLDGGWLAPRAVRGRAAAAAALRDELVERVERAERRAFGGEGARWEEMVGAWVQCTPARPRAAAVGAGYSARATPRVTPKTPRVVESSDEEEDEDSRRPSPEPWDAGDDMDVDDGADDCRRPAVEDTPIPARVRERAATKKKIPAPQLTTYGKPAACAKPAANANAATSPKATSSRAAFVKPSLPSTLSSKPATQTTPAKGAKSKSKKLRPVFADRHLNGTPYSSKFVPAKARQSPAAGLAALAHLGVPRAGMRYPGTPGVVRSPIRKRTRFVRDEPPRVRGVQGTDEDSRGGGRADAQGPSSDDVLDLFGYPTSSPVKTRRVAAPM